MDLIEADGKRVADRVNNQQRIRAVMDYQLALLIAMGINSPKNFPKSVEAAYPGVFKEEEEKQHEEDWHVIKAQMAAHGEAYAIRHGGGESS